MYHEHYSYISRDIIGNRWRGKKIENQTNSISIWQWCIIYGNFVRHKYVYCI